MTRVKTLCVDVGTRVGINQFPSIHKSASITGMKEKYYGTDALLVRCGSYIYNVSARPDVYAMAH